MIYERFIAYRYLFSHGAIGAFILSLAFLLPPVADIVIGLLAMLVALLLGIRPGFITVISGISILGIKLGVMALITVLSVFNGFNGLVKSLLVGFDPHVRVTAVSGGTIDPQEVLATLQTIPGLVAAAPFVSGRSAIINEDGLRVIQVRGMRKADVTGAIGLGNRIVSGRFEDASDRYAHPIVLGTLLSYALGAQVGDSIALLSQTGLEETLTDMTEPTIIRCVVTGLFESSNKEYDTYFAYTDLETARQLFALPSGAMGVEARFADLEFAPQAAALLRTKLGAAYRVETWQDLHHDLFAVMELERWAAFVILLLIVIVAVFNVLGSLTMTVTKKRRDIGILKTMGASDRSVMKIFMSEGGLIGMIGTVAGAIYGIALCVLQQEYGLFRLDNAVYIVSALPLELRVNDVMIVCSAALVLSLCASIYPARRAAGLLPADAVRWE
jgi:lipoprotein-releasing system permease protein